MSEDKKPWEKYAKTPETNSTTDKKPWEKYPSSEKKNPSQTGTVEQVVSSTESLQPTTASVSPSPSVAGGALSGLNTLTQQRHIQPEAPKPVDTSGMIENTGNFLPNINSPEGIVRTSDVTLEGNNEPSTVLMSSYGEYSPPEANGKYVSFPTLFPKDPNNQTNNPSDWIIAENDDQAYEIAKKRGELKYFDTPEEASKYAEGSWKQTTPPPAMEDGYQDPSKDIKEIVEKNQKLKQKDPLEPVQNPLAKPEDMVSSNNTLFYNNFKDDVFDKTSSIKSQKFDQELKDFQSIFGFTTLGYNREDLPFIYTKSSPKEIKKEASEFLSQMDNDLYSGQYNKSSIKEDELLKYIDDKLRGRHTNPDKNELLKKVVIEQVMGNGFGQLNVYEKKQQERKEKERKRDVGIATSNLYGETGAKSLLEDFGVNIINKEIGVSKKEINKNDVNLSEDSFKSLYDENMYTYDVTLEDKEMFPNIDVSEAAGGVEKFQSSGKKSNVNTVKDLSFEEAKYLYEKGQLRFANPLQNPAFSKYVESYAEDLKEEKSLDYYNNMVESMSRRGDISKIGSYEKQKIDKDIDSKINNELINNDFFFTDNQKQIYSIIEDSEDLLSKIKESEEKLKGLESFKTDEERVKYYNEKTNNDLLNEKYNQLELQADLLKRTETTDGEGGNLYNPKTGKLLDAADPSNQDPFIMQWNEDLKAKVKEFSTYQDNLQKIKAKKYAEFQYIKQQMLSQERFKPFHDEISKGVIPQNLVGEMGEFKIMQNDQLFDSYIEAARDLKAIGIAETLNFDPTTIKRSKSEIFSKGFKSTALPLIGIEDKVVTNQDVQNDFISVLKDEGVEVTDKQMKNLELTTAESAIYSTAASIAPMMEIMLETALTEGLGAFSTIKRIHDGWRASKVVKNSAALKSLVNFSEFATGSILEGSIYELADQGFVTGVAEKTAQTVSSKIKIPGISRLFAKSPLSRTFGMALNTVLVKIPVSTVAQTWEEIIGDISQNIYDNGGDIEKAWLDTMGDDPMRRAVEYLMTSAMLGGASAFGHMGASYNEMLQDIKDYKGNDKVIIEYRDSILKAEKEAKEVNEYQGDKKEEESKELTPTIKTTLGVDGGAAESLYMKKDGTEVSEEELISMIKSGDNAVSDMTLTNPSEDVRQAYGDYNKLLKGEKLGFDVVKPKQESTDEQETPVQQEEQAVTQEPTVAKPGEQLEIPFEETTTQETEVERIPTQEEVEGLKTRLDEDKEFLEKNRSWLDESLIKSYEKGIKSMEEVLGGYNEAVSKSSQPTVSTEETTTETTVEPTKEMTITEEVAAQKADIERRRQEEIGTKESRRFTDDDGITWTTTISENKDGKVVRVKGEKNGEVVGQYENKYPKQISNEKIYETENADGYEWSEIKQEKVEGKRTDKINAKYDAELEAVGTTTETTVEPTPEVVEQAPVLEEGAEVTMPPRIKGGMQQSFVFQDGQWKQKVGGQVSEISESQQQDVQAAFDQQSTTEVTQEVKAPVTEAKAVETTTPKQKAIDTEIEKVKQGEKSKAGESIYELKKKDPKAYEEKLTELEEAYKAKAEAKAKSETEVKADEEQEYEEVVTTMISSAFGTTVETKKVPKKKTISEVKKIKKQNIDEADKLISSAKTEDQKKAFGTIKNVIKALAKVDPEAEVVVHESQESYSQAVKEAGGDIADGKSAGMVNLDGKIHINASEVKSNTVFHEGAHKVIDAVIKSDPIAKRKMQKELERAMSSADAKAMDDFAKGYVPKEFVNKYGSIMFDKMTDEQRITYYDEYATEALSRIADGTIKLTRTNLEKVKDLIRAIAKAVGLDPKEINLSSEDNVKDFARKLSEAFREGKEIKTEGFTSDATNQTNKFQANFSDVDSKMTFVYDKNGSKFKELQDKGYITKDKSIKDFNGQTIFLHQPDGAFSGSIYKNNELLIEGKGGVYYPIKFHEEGFFWASTASAAETMASQLNKAAQENGGKLLMALTTAPKDKLLSSTTAANAVLDLFLSKSFDENFSLTEKEVKSALVDAMNSKSVKKTLIKDKDGQPVLDKKGNQTYKEKQFGLDMKAKKNQNMDELLEQVRDRLNPEKSSFDERKLFVTELIKGMADTINSKPRARQQFGAFFDKGIQRTEWKQQGKIEKGYKISSTNLREAIQEMITEPMLKNEGENGGRVYAIIELQGKPGEPVVKAVDSNKHESYPKAIQSNVGNEVKLHVLKDRTPWNEVFKDPKTGEIVTEGREKKIYPTSGVSVQGLELDTSSIESSTETLRSKGEGEEVSIQEQPTEARQKVKFQKPIAKKATLFDEMMANKGKIDSGEMTVDDFLDRAIDLGVSFRDVMELYDQTKQAKPEQTKISKSVKRAAESQDSESERKIKALSGYKVRTFAEISNFIDAVLSEFTPREAIENASRISDFDPVKKNNLIQEAGGMIVNEAIALEEKAKKDKDPVALEEAMKMKLEGLEAIREASLNATAAGQEIAYKQHLYKKYPHVYLMNDLAKFTKAESGALDEYNGKGETLRQSIQGVQSNIASELNKAVDEAFNEDALLQKIAELEEEIKTLKRKPSSQKSKQEATEAKKKAAKDKIASGLAKLMKKSSSASISITGLNNEQISGIIEIMTGVIQLGATSTKAIINKTMAYVKQAVPSINKDHLTIIAETLAEYNVLKAKEEAATEANKIKELEKKLKALQEGNEDIDLTERKEDSDEVKALKEAIRNERVLTPSSIKELAKQFYAGQVPGARNLAEAIVSKNPSINEADAKKLADALEEKIIAKVKKVVDTEVAQFLKPKKESIAELRKKRERGTLTADEAKELKEREKKASESKEVNKIIKLISRGALEKNTEFNSVFAKRFGFNEMPDSVTSRLLSIIDRINTLAQSTSKEVELDSGEKVTINTQRGQEIAQLSKDFNSLIYANKKVTSAKVLKEMLDASYIAMLSGPATFVRAGLGGYSSAVFGTMTFLASNPMQSGVFFKELFKSIPAAYKRAIISRKIGIDYFGENALKGEVGSTQSGYVERTFLRGLGEAINDKRYGLAGVKLATQSFKIIHTLGALDTFMNVIAGNAMGAALQERQVRKDLKVDGKTLSERNKEIRDRRRAKSLMEAPYRATALSEYNNLKESIEGTVDILIASGKISESNKDSEVNKRIKAYMGLTGSLRDPKKTYVTNRAQELKENALERHLEYAVTIAKEASLMGKPDGLEGRMAESIQKGLSMKEDGDIFSNTAKFLGASMFRFVRLFAQSISKAKTNIPVLGIANAVIGPGVNPITGEWDNRFLGKAYANPALMRQRIATNIAITTVFSLAFAHMFEVGDEDDDLVTKFKNLFNPSSWKMDPDRMIDIRGYGQTGRGGDAANKMFYEDWSNLSISWQKDKDGNFDNYVQLKLNAELAAVVATLAAFSDDIQGYSKPEDVYARSNAGLSSYIGKIIGNNFRVSTEGSFSSIGRFLSDFNKEDEITDGFAVASRNMLAESVKPIINPSIVSSATKFYQAAKGQNQSKVEGVWSNMMNNWLGVDRVIMDDKTDIFGNPYPEISDYQKFFDYSKRSEDPALAKTVGLQYKFDRGLNIKKVKFSEMAMDDFDGFSAGNGVYLRAKDEKIKKEAIDLQEKYFKDMVIEDYDYLNGLETREELEEEMKAIQTLSKKYAKWDIMDKYEGTDKLEVVEQ